MADKLVKAVKKSRADMWSAFKTGISITGYRYYKPHDEIKYRYPAPGSCAFDELDKAHMYKLDWKTPFRTIEYNVRPIELVYDDDDPRMAINHVSQIPEFDDTHPRFGKYDAVALAHTAPEVKSTLMHADIEPGSDAARDLLWDTWAAAPERQAWVRDSHAPGQFDFEDDYHPKHDVYRPRGATGFEGQTRAKEMFIELEWWIEEVVGKQRRLQGGVKAYKGTPKKWQVLDDAVFDADQVAKLQGAMDAPLPEQLDAWAEKHGNSFIQAPFNNENIHKWRDDPAYNDSADFDPKLLGYDREEKKRIFL